MRLGFFVAMAFLLGYLSADAQTVVTAQSGVAFPASADHNVSDGTVPRVASYQLDVMAQNVNGALAFTFSLGKPTPDASNTITVKPIANFGTLTAGQYVATVTAIGPGGQGRSPASDPFVRPGAPGAPGKPTVVQ